MWLLLHGVGQSKLQAQPRFKGRKSTHQLSWRRPCKDRSGRNLWPPSLQTIQRRREASKIISTPRRQHPITGRSPTSLGSQGFLQALSETSGHAVTLSWREKPSDHLSQQVPGGQKGKKGGRQGCQGCGPWSIAGQLVSWVQGWLLVGQDTAPRGL